MYNVVTFANLDIYYTPELDGGGISFAQDYVACVRQRFGPVERCFEWCAGPGFIGFAILAHELCHSLCLADINPKAVAACQETVRRNRLEDRVTVYLSDCLEQIPTTEQWDLVVGNPPHFHTPARHAHFGPKTLYMDENWAIHQRFYQQIKPYMRLSGHILIAEHSRFSTLEMFRPLIENNGLQLMGTLPCQLPSRIYYVWSRA